MKPDSKLDVGGDHLMSPFQCDICIGRTLKGSTLDSGSRKDQLLACCIRRANLDVLWSREASTVAAHVRHIKQMLSIWSNLGVEPKFPPIGPFPFEDVQGMGVAVAMLYRSLDPGRYGDYTQFGTIRKLRSAYSNLYNASAEASLSMASLGRDTSKMFLTQCTTQGIWFEKFTRGCLSRMGEVVRQDLAVTSALMKELLQLIDEHWLAESDPWKQSELASIGLYCASAFLGSFRGHEVFLMDLHGLLHYEEEYRRCDQTEFCMIPLLGRYKGETNSRYHLTPLARVTTSGINLGLWVQRVCTTRRLEGRRHGPVFADRWGGPVNPRHYELMILDRIQIVKERFPSLIPDTVIVHEEYGISRSFRCGATTEAKNRGVPDRDIDLMNRWRNVENAKGHKARMRMNDHYADIKQMVPALLRFSKAL